MPTKLLQLDLFGAPAVEVHELEQPGALLSDVVPVGEPVAVPVLPGQLSLLEARSTRLAPAVDSLAEGRFDAAASFLAGLEGEVELRREVDALAAQIAAAPTADDQAGLALDEAIERIEAVGTAALGAAVRRGLPAAVARRLDGAAVGARALGKLSAHYWLLSLQPAEALAAAERLLEAEPARADAWVLRGNALLATGDLASARRAWWRALRAAPLDTVVADIADDEVRGLVAETAELELAPPEAWLPIVGLLMGVFAWSGDPFDREPTPADRFFAALARSRAATARGRADIETRRSMKQFAPMLFERLLEEGLV